MTLKPAIEAREPSTEPREGRLPRWLTIVLSILLFAGAFYGVRTFVAAQWTWQPDGTSANKLAAYAGTADQYNTVALGSSRVFRQVDPTSFDARMAELGYGTSTFNFGVAGMTAIEARDYLRRILELAPETLEFVVIAPEEVRGELKDNNVDSVRTIAWHDTTNTVMALRAAWNGEDDFDDKASYIYNHLAAYVTNFTGTGEFLADLALDADPDEIFDVGLRGNGWLSLDDREEMSNDTAARSLRQRRRRLEQNVGEEGFPRLVAGLTSAVEAVDANPPSLGSMEADYLADLVDLVRAAGAEPLFLVPPGGEYRGGWLHSAEAAGAIPVLFDFNDPRPYPDLFTYEAWFDQNHLNEAASVRFSTYLADEVAAYLGETMPDLDLPPRPTIDIEIDVTTLAEESIALDLDGATLVKNDARAFLSLTGVEGLHGDALEITFGDDVLQTGAQLQANIDGKWQKVGERLEAVGGVVVLPLDEAPLGARLRVKVIGGVGTRIESVRVLGVIS
jgi:hypothetical protein